MKTKQIKLTNNTREEVFLCLEPEGNIESLTKDERAIRIETVNRSDRYVKGLVTKMFYYKGHSIRVKYTVDNKEYENSSGWSKNPNNVHEGDSIWLRYAIEDPNLFITELENDY